MYDIIAIGELLMDFTPAGKSKRNNLLYECNPGGGVANLAAAAAKFGANVLFISKVGNDSFGHMLKDAVTTGGVDSSRIVFSGEYQTTLAFVHLFENGERDFTFYRRTGADAMLRKEDVDFSLIANARLLHISSLNMTNDTSADVIRSAVKKAKEFGVPVSYDPNWRPLLWTDEKTCKARMAEGLSLADIIKAGEEELAYITDEPDTETSARKLLNNGARLVIVSKGESGSEYYHKNGSGSIDAVPVRAVDATGAGDCYFGTALTLILKEIPDLDNIEESALRRCLNIASAAAALCCTRKGGMPSMPTYSEAAELLQKH
ncbi:MAG: 5-dehydro-2-deoxygluconokinase [Firmicutes bacterium ADurb.Bin182]|nr:MAG: 5-dehydro-2-deoxygluconokinase [Firmicutes bacterium ADurb.Bin182]